MSMFKEVQETDKPIETEKQRLSTAFENNKKNEGGETRHLKTINEQYEGNIPERMWSISMNGFR